MNNQGGKRINSGRKPISVLEKKVQIRIYIRKCDVERYGYKFLANIAKIELEKTIENLSKIKENKIADSENN